MCVHARTPTHAHTRTHASLHPQAFRHSYGLPLEWRFWEPLVLMIDEVYRSRADGTLAVMHAAQKDKIKVGWNGRGAGSNT